MVVQIYGFIFVMWILMLVGGGLIVVVIGPFSIGGLVDIEPIIFSGIKVGVALFLIFIWVLILTKVKNWVFRSQIKS